MLGEGGNEGEVPGREVLARAAVVADDAAVTAHGVDDGVLGAVVVDSGGGVGFGDHDCVGGLLVEGGGMGGGRTGAADLVGHVGYRVHADHAFCLRAALLEGVAADDFDCAGEHHVDFSGDQVMI